MKIESYSFGKIVIDGKEYTSDLIILPEKIKPNWWRKSGHKLCKEDIEEVLKEEIEVLIVGKGMSGIMEVLPEVVELLKSKNIELIAKDTKVACEIFNKISESKKVAAVLHLTC